MMGRRGERFPWFAVLLPAALLLTLLLALEAVLAARSQRALAEKVVRDDAALAANEFVRNARTEVGYFAFYPTVRIVSDLMRVSGELPDVAQLSTRPPIAPLAFLKSLAAADLETGRVRTSRPASPEVAAWFEENLPRLARERASPRGDLSIVHAVVGGSRRSFVYGVSPSAARPVALAFEVDLAALSASWSKAAQSPLPEPLASAAQSGAVFLALEDPWGRVIYATPGRFTPANSYARTVEGADNVLAGLTVRASIAPEAAAHLAPALPPAWVALSAVAAALAAALLVAAFVLWRRERALARRQADFVSSVSHELRTPLAQIRLFTETLRLDRVRSDEERRRSLAIVDQEARRLTRLVENTLVLARSERGAGRIARRPEDLAAVVRGTLEVFSPLAEAAGARIEADLPEGVVAEVDADGVRQVLVNLLDNAVTYGPAGQRVAVGLARTDGSIRITVEDEGPGIPPADRERVFEKFERLARDRETHRTGTGIGLAVARELVALHGGTIRAEAAERGGARLVVELPASAEAPA